MNSKFTTDNMIDFACKTIEVEELIRCSFQLSKTDYRLLLRLLGSKGSVKDLAEEMNLDRTTVNKSLTKLLDRKLVERRQYNISSGGYRYVYRAKDKEEIKKRVRDLIENWGSSAKEAIDDW
ncbi:MAG: helix-turn-helix domain-containing protein [Candidatus Aenigmatarchaeota archaeon]